ncbi:hypothetical protein MASR2M70_21050 [Bacillota bacterium]
MDSIIFIDCEISMDGRKILDLGAVKPDNSQFHSASQKGFADFVAGTEFICGHNIIEHIKKINFSS